MRISTIARSTESGFLVRHWDAPRRGIQRQGPGYRDECKWGEVERRFSQTKHRCGMGLVTAKLRETAAHVIDMSVLVLNPCKIQCALLRLLTCLLIIFPSRQKRQLFSKH